MSSDDEIIDIERKPYYATEESVDQARPMRWWARGILLALTVPWIVVLVIAIRLHPYDENGAPLRLGTHQQVIMPGQERGLPECTFNAIAGVPCPSCGMTTSFSLQDLLNTEKLVCNNYGYLATELYHVVFPSGSDPGTTIQMIGFGAGPFGNHAQIIFVNGNFSLLCDPTLGLVARTTFASLLAGHPVASSVIHQWVYRVEATQYMQNAMSNFRSEVYSAIVGGLYPNASLIYDRNVSNLD